MRNRVVYAAGGMAMALLACGTIAILRAPGGAPGPVAKIAFFYAPAAFVALLAASTAMVASVLFLRTKDLRFDGLAVSATEVGLVFLTASMVTGCIWGYALRGVWWTWDPAVTSALVCGLVYASYLMLRRAIEEPSQRAAFCAVWSLFCFLDAPIAVAAVYRWRAQHPHAALWAGLPASWLAALVWNAAAMVAVGVALVAVRLRQEGARRKLDSLRRTMHVM